MKKETIEVIGPTAAMVLQAYHSSFYGIHGDGIDCAKARKACYDRVSAYLDNVGIKWNSLSLIWAKPIDTDGTKTPYKAEITFTYD